jgi:hypothetical protein
MLYILLCIATDAVLIRCLIDDRSGVPGLVSLLAMIVTILLESFRVYAIFKFPHWIRRVEVQVLFISACASIAAYAIITSVSGGWYSVAAIGRATAVVFAGFCAYAIWHASQIPPYEAAPEDNCSLAEFEMTLWDCAGAVGAPKCEDTSGESPKAETQP